MTGLVKKDVLQTPDQEKAIAGEDEYDFDPF